MESYARSRVVPGGVQLEIDVETAREIATLIHAEVGTESPKLAAVAKTIDNTLEVPR